MSSGGVAGRVNRGATGGGTGLVGVTVRPVETEPTTFETQLLRHAERQTKALENINWVLMALFVLFLIGAAISVIGALSGSG